MINKKSKKEIETQDIVSTNYEKVRYEKPYSRAYHLWWSKMMLDNATSSGLWLDLGCGTGWTMDALSGLGYKRRLIGVDISRGMLKWARRKGMDVALGDGRNLPFGTASFDVVMAKGVLHHVQELDLAVSEITRVLKPGGVALLTDPNKSILRGLNMMISNRERHFSEDHKSMSTKEYLVSVSRHMKIEKFNNFGFLAYPFCIPDIWDIGRLIPFNTLIVRILIKIDNLIARIPGVRALSWAYFVKLVRI